jgi:hypothetical protein
MWGVGWEEDGRIYIYKGSCVRKDRDEAHSYTQVVERTVKERPIFI